MTKKVFIYFIFLFSILSMVSYATPTRQMISYYDAGTTVSDLKSSLKTDGVTTLDLAFATLSGTTVSLADNAKPAKASGASQSYIDWTSWRNEDKDSKVLLSFGGEDGASTWSDIATADQNGSLGTIVSAIKATIESDYPIYNAAWGTTVVGTLHGLDGVDLDVEAAPGASITPLEAKAVGDLIVALKTAMPDKIVTLTGISVGADTQADGLKSSLSNDDKGYGLSIHSGELSATLENTQAMSDLDYINVMAYAGGPYYQSTGWETAMNNYAYYIKDKSKVVLGVTGGPQWSHDAVSITESVSTVTDRYSASKGAGYLNVMYWAISGVAGDAQYNEYLLALSKI